LSRRPIKLDVTSAVELYISAPTTTCLYILCFS